MIISTPTTFAVFFADVSARAWRGDPHRPLSTRTGKSTVYHPIMIRLFEKASTSAKSNYLSAPFPRPPCRSFSPSLSEAGADNLRGQFFAPFGNSVGRDSNSIPRLGIKSWIIPCRDTGPEGRHHRIHEKVKGFSFGTEVQTSFVFISPKTSV